MSSGRRMTRGNRPLACSRPSFGPHQFAGEQERDVAEPHVLLGLDGDAGDVLGGNGLHQVGDPLADGLAALVELAPPTAGRT